MTRIIQQAVKQGIYQSINEALVEMYATDGHTIIHSFKKWMEEGYVMKRGEKALLLWGQPRTSQNQQKKNDDDKDEFSFFPLAYVLSQKQVEPLANKNLSR